MGICKCKSAFTKARLCLKFYPRCEECAGDYDEIVRNDKQLTELEERAKEAERQAAGCAQHAYYGD